MSLLVRHPANPERPYVPWQRKLRFRLDELLRVQDPDIRTKGEIAALKNRLGIKERIPSSPAARYKKKRADRLKSEGRCIDCAAETNSKYAYCFECRKKASIRRKAAKKRRLGLTMQNPKKLKSEAKGEAT